MSYVERKRAQRRLKRRRNALGFTLLGTLGVSLYCIATGEPLGESLVATAIGTLEAGLVALVALLVTGE